MSLSLELEQFIDSLGLRYFKGAEFTEYWSRKRNGATNSPPPRELWTNIVKTLVVLDEIRHRLGASITLNSTYRSPAYNRAIAGAGKSLHMEFKAIDFTCDKGKPSDWAKVAKDLRGQAFHLPASAGLGTRFVFRGGVGVYPTFVHIDTRGADANW
jgi:uncharacterized protein YcbK (DUF882 family)